MLARVGWMMEIIKYTPCRLSAHKNDNKYMCVCVYMSIYTEIAQNDAHHQKHILKRLPFQAQQQKWQKSLKKHKNIQPHTNIHSCTDNISSTELRTFIAVLIN